MHFLYIDSPYLANFARTTGTSAGFGSQPVHNSTNFQPTLSPESFRTGFLSYFAFCTVENARKKASVGNCVITENWKTVGRGRWGMYLSGIGVVWKLEF